MRMAKDRRAGSAVAYPFTRDLAISDGVRHTSGGTRPAPCGDVRPLPPDVSRCMVCGGADADVVADHRSVRDEIEALWAYHARRLRADTPPTRLVDRVTFSENPPLRVVRCRGCGLVYRNPAEPARAVVEAYRRAAPPPDALRALHSAQYGAARSQVRRLRRALGRRCSGLEVGCY